MVSLTALWLPILISAVLVFVMSSLTHMVLKLHKNDYDKLPGEDAIMEVMRKEGVQPGNYHVPYCKEMSDMAKPEMVTKLKAGPVGLFNVFPSGPPAMGKYLAQWFVYTIFVGVFVGYLAGRSIGPGAEYMTVFRLVSTAAFIAYAVGEPMSSIWKGQKWSTTARHMFDGFLYSLLTAGAFAWLWP